MCAFTSIALFARYIDDYLQNNKTDKMNKKWHEIKNIQSIHKNIPLKTKVNF